MNLVKLLAALLLLAAARTTAGVTPELRYFRYERAIENLPRTARQACFAIPAAIFAHSAPELADLRLYRGTVETPYVTHLAAPVGGTDQQVAPLNLGHRAGQTVFDAAMPEGNYRDVQLLVTGQNFIATVYVSGSQTQTGSPQTRFGAFTIFDLTQQKLGRSTVLHLPKSDFRFLHFQIVGPLAPDDIKGLTVQRVAAAEPRYITVAASSEVIQKDRDSVIEFTVPAHVPVDQVVFVPGAQPANFSRDVQIGVVPIEPHRAGIPQVPPLQTASFGNLLRIHRREGGHSINEERLSVDAPANVSATETKWTITIKNGDDAPIQLRSIRLEMMERDLCFDAAGSTDYTLYYGDPALSLPQYDYARLFTRQPDAAQAAVGPESLNPAYQPRPDTRPLTEKHPLLLWIALALVILVLGAIALRSAKRTAA